MKAVCEICEKSKTGVFKRRKLKQMTCTNCYNVDRYHDPSTHEKCSRCGEKKQVAERTEEGPICPNCYRRDPSRHEECSRCGEKKQVRERTEEGPICAKCRIGECAGCGQEKIIQAMGLCYGCYQAQRRQKQTTQPV